MGGIASALGGGGGGGKAKYFTADKETTKRARTAADELFGANQDANVFRQAQVGLLPQLQQLAMGQGPSAAQAMLQAQNSQNLRNSLALAAQGRGINPALAQRQALMQSQMGNQQALEQSMGLRAQEQLNAQNMLAQLAGQGRAGDTAYEQALKQLALGYEQQAYAPLRDTQAINAGIRQANMQAQAQRQQANQGLLGGLIGAAGSIGANFLFPGAGAVVGPALTAGTSYLDTSSIA